MPYTPPSHCSPASSAPTSPSLSRRSSFATQSRPALPRSTSYLTKHRRSASATSVASAASLQNGSTTDITSSTTSDSSKDVSTSVPAIVRQSPPPVTDSRGMPAGAIISPPESSSEDEGALGPEEKERERNNIKELKEAISAIPQYRAGSPNRTQPSTLLLLSEIDRLAEPTPKPTLRTLGLQTGRTVSHSRSNTDSHIYLSKSEDVSGSEESSEQDEIIKKPPMLRKKSGELVRPALRPASVRRPSSMPGTPTFSKAVHFDSHLEHVRHFLQVDRPLAVSTGSSPTDNYDSDTEYPFKPYEKPAPRSPPHEWEIVTNKFAPETPARRALPVRLERVWMSPDQKSLIGSISVANLAFNKSVVCRFTFDYWKTTSEVAAQYHHEIRERQVQHGHDRFQFSIKLSDIANLEAKTLYFCIRYSVNGLEYWDNNESINFQVDFRKKFTPQNGKKNFQGASQRPANSLPRSNRRTNPSTAARPSIPASSLDESFKGLKIGGANHDIHEFLREAEPPAPRLKMSKSTTSLPSDNLPGRLPPPSGVAFANRYDFGASLNAAKQAQRSPTSSPPRNDGLYMKPHQRTGFDLSAPAEVPRSESSLPKMKPIAVQQQTSGYSGYSSPSATPGTVSPGSASIASASYEEILNKYCFFNSSKQSSPQVKDDTLRSGRYDGASEYSFQSSTSHQPSLGGIPSYVCGSYRAGGSPAVSPGSSPKRSPVPSDSTTTTATFIAASNAPINGAIPDRTQRHHMQYIKDHSSFTSDSRSPKAISC